MDLGSSLIAFTDLVRFRHPHYGKSLMCFMKQNALARACGSGDTGLKRGYSAMRDRAT